MGLRRRIPISTSANPSHLYAANGTYTATLTVNNSTLTGQATTQVVVGKSPPNATLLTPTSGATYNGGQTISLSGSASDATDGTEPGSAFSWQVDFISNGVAQPFYNLEVPARSTRSAASRAAHSRSPRTCRRRPRRSTNHDDGDRLTRPQDCHDRDIHPNLTSWTVNANVPNTMFFVDGSLKTGSFSTTDVVGIQHVLIGIPAQVIGGLKYRHNGWADGSALSDSFTSGASPATYTDNLDPVSGSLPAGWRAPMWRPVDGRHHRLLGGNRCVLRRRLGDGCLQHQRPVPLHVHDLVGDGTIVARVRYQSNTNPSAKAGVMFKETPTAGATYAAALVYPDVSLSTPNFNGVGCNANGCAAPLPPVIPTYGKGVRLQYSTTAASARRRRCPTT